MQQATQTGLRLGAARAGAAAPAAPAAAAAAAAAHPPLHPGQVHHAVNADQGSKVHHLAPASDAYKRIARAAYRICGPEPMARHSHHLIRDNLRSCLHPRASLDEPGNEKSAKQELVARDPKRVRWAKPLLHSCCLGECLEQHVVDREGFGYRLPSYCLGKFCCSNPAKARKPCYPPTKLSFGGEGEEPLRTPVPEGMLPQPSPLLGNPVVPRPAEKMAYSMFAAHDEQRGVEMDWNLLFRVPSVRPIMDADDNLEERLREAYVALEEKGPSEEAALAAKHNVVPFELPLTGDGSFITKKVLQEEEWTPQIRRNLERALPLGSTSVMVAHECMTSVGYWAVRDELAKMVHGRGKPNPVKLAAKEAKAAKSHVAKRELRIGLDALGRDYMCALHDRVPTEAEPLCEYTPLSTAMACLSLYGEEEEEDEEEVSDDNTAELVVREFLVAVQEDSPRVAQAAKREREEGGEQGASSSETAKKLRLTPVA